MKKPKVTLIAVVLSLSGFVSAQDSAVPPASPAETEGRPKLPRLGIDLRVSTLGPGIEASTAVLRKANIRAGFNYFSYSLSQTKKGLTYDGQLHFASAEAFFDWFPFGGNYHISPGLLIYNGNHADASLSAAGGTKFTLNGDTYYSSQASPLTGTASVALNSNKVSPAILFGWGNPLPRTRKHVIFNVEGGVVFMGSPNAVLNLSGSTCTVNGTQCQSITDNSKIQSDIQVQQTKINNDISFFKCFPVISFGFGYKF